MEAWFTPYYSDSIEHLVLMKAGATEPAINGYKRRGLCADTLNALGLRVDLGAERNEYDLWVCPNDAAVPSNLGKTPMVLVQEGIMEQPNWRTWVWRYTRLMPRPLATTAVFGLTRRYEKFCVASEGYRKQFLAEGSPGREARRHRHPQLRRLRPLPRQRLPPPRLRAGLHQ